MSLSNKKQTFIAEYLKDFNATQAAIRAGYSAKTAYSIGQRLLKNVEIKEVIDAHLKANHMSAEEVLNRLADIARGDMTDLMDVSSMGFTVKLTDEQGNRRPQTKLIKKLKQKVITKIGKNSSDDDTETVETEIELYSAQDALNQIGKYHKLFTDKVEHEVAKDSVLESLLKAIGLAYGNQNEPDQPAS